MVALPGSLNQLGPSRTRANKRPGPGNPLPGKNNRVRRFAAASFVHTIAWSAMFYTLLSTSSLLGTNPLVLCGVGTIVSINGVSKVGIVLALIFLYGLIPSHHLTFLFYSLAVN